MGRTLIFRRLQFPWLQKEYWSSNTYFVFVPCFLAVPALQNRCTAVFLECCTKRNNDFSHIYDKSHSFRSLSVCRVERGKNEDWKGQKRSKVKRVTLFHSKPVNEDLFWIQILAFFEQSPSRAWNSMPIQIVARVVCQLFFSSSKLHKIGSYFSPDQRYSESLFSTFCYVLYLTMNYWGLTP